MFIIGIAGASGTGKSTIATHLADRLGGFHIDADRVGHELLEGDAHVVELVRRRFGEEVFGEDGAVDRRLLGAVVFSDADARLDLNAIIHPAIRRHCGDLVAAAGRSGGSYAVLDAALLLDSEMPFSFDLMIALRCDTEARFARIMSKGGWSEEEVKRRLASQQDIEKSFYKADVVVDTDGDLNHTIAEIDRVVDAAIER